MESDQLKSNIFIGLVVDNQDPKKLGRIKVQVLNVFDNIPTSDLPYCSPWKDLNGNCFNVPDIGKVVSVVFDQGNKYMPEYIYAQHYNVNIQNKLNRLEGSDYTSFKAVFMDQSTQIYRTNTEGLVIDHEYSNVTLDADGDISLNLRDNNSLLTLGSNNADENAVLGSTFMNWMDTFVQNLLGTNGGPYLGNLGAPVVANPGMINCLTQYQQLRNNFLSENVKLNKNGQIIAQSRDYINQYGDDIKSTGVENVNLSTKKPPNYIPDSNDIPIVSSTSSTTSNSQGVNSALQYSSSKGDGNVPSHRTIKGVTFENGNIPDSYLQEISSGLKQYITSVNQSDNGRARMMPDAMKNFEKMMSDAQTSGIYLYINSSYRTISDQQRVYQQNCGNGRCIVPTAKPGTSNHGFGLAVDIANNSAIKINSSMPEYKWLAQNAIKYNFKRIASETWHWEYQTS